LLIRTHQEWQPKILKNYEKITESFINRGWSHIDVRVRSNYAIFMAGTVAAFEQINKYFGQELLVMDEDFSRELYHFVYKEMKETQTMTESDHPINKFLAKIGLLANQHVLLPNVDYICEKGKDGNVYLYLAPTNVMD